MGRGRCFSALILHFGHYVFRTHPKYCLKFCVLRFTTVLDTLTSSYALKHVVDEALPHSDYWNLLLWALLLIATLVLKSVCCYWIHVLPFGQVTTTVRGLVLKRFLRIPLEKRKSFDEFVHVQVLDLIQTASYQLIPSGVIAYMDLLVATTQFFGSYCLMAHFIGFRDKGHLAIHSAVMVFILLSWCCNFYLLLSNAGWVQKSCRKVYEAQEDAGAELYKLLRFWETHENLHEKDTSAYLGKASNWQKENKNYNLGRYRVEYCDGVISQVVIIAWICFGGYLVIEKGMTVGEFVAITNLLKQIAETLHNMYLHVQSMVICDALLCMISRLLDCSHPWLPLSDSEQIISKHTLPLGSDGPAIWTPWTAIQHNGVDSHTQSHTQSLGVSSKERIEDEGSEHDVHV